MSKLKKLGALLILSVIVNFAPSPAKADYDQARAVAYLKSHTIDEWSVMTLASANSLSGINLDFLKIDPGNKPTDIEKRILAIVAAGADPETFGQVNLLQKLTSNFNGTEINSPLASNLLNDDIFGLLALTAANKHLDVRNGLAGFIKQNQNPDGGFSYTYKGSPSDSNDTAMAVMALLSNGESANSAAINNALSYLDAAKTSTGYSFDATSGFGPDAASTAWVLSALKAAGRNAPGSAIDYLKGLQTTDGSFAWVAGAQGQTLMTAYALVALNNDYYPVKSGTNSNLPQFQVFIKGPSNAVFQGEVAFNQFAVSDSAGQTHSFTEPRAIGTVSESAKVGSFSYVIRNTSLGLFVECIANICPSGTSGWMYAVNGTKPNIGSAQYILNNQDKVIWFLGGPNDPVPAWPGTSNTSQPVNLSANILPLADPANPTVSLTASKTQINLGETVQLTWDSQNAGFVVNSPPNNWAGNILSGSISAQPSQTTTYSITVGSCPSNFNWTRHMDTTKNPALPVCQSGSTTVNGAVASASVIIAVNQQPSITFGIDTTNISFGDLRAGQTSSQKPVRLINTGGVNLRITTTLQNADQLYQQGLFLDSTIWSNFAANLDANFAKTLNLTLQVPPSYSSTGIKNGTLIFWASPR